MKVRVTPSRSTAPTPPPEPNTHPWRRIVTAIAAAGPDASDLMVARRLKVAPAHVAHVRAAIAPMPTLAPLVVERVAIRPTIICANCGREGTPASAHPTWCKACAAGADEVRGAWDPPPPSPQTQAALAMIERAGPNRIDGSRLTYLRLRAQDYANQEALHG